MISEFAEEKVFWTRKMNLKLVYFIKNKPNIWNPNHPKYTSAECKDQTYAEFAAQYGDKFTGRAVKNRWTNIRSTFAKYLRKLNSSRAQGEDYKVSWHLWGPCQFLMKVNRTVKHLSQDLNETNEEKDSSTEEIYNNEDMSENNVNNTDSNYCQRVVEGLVEVFKRMKNDPFGLDKSKYGGISQVIADQLSLMDSYEAARTIKNISEILLFYDENNPQNPNNINT
ncbi:uncharacterized protein [Battus philenor]|uniref:uncharacterized protein n=1 Tax=Battus philenor TaxID=42288 RepID=UPI0035CF2856